MIDLKTFRRDPEPYVESAKLRGLKIDFDKIKQLDGQRTQLTGQVDDLRAKLNLKDKPTAEQLKQLQQTKTKLATLETKLKEIDGALEALLNQVPNLVAEGTPEGGEEANKEERSWGKATKREIQDHLTLAQDRGWLDFERGAKVAGHKFYYLMGPLVKLEMAVTALVNQRLEEAGFTLMQVPSLVKPQIANGTGYLPRGEESQIYQVEGHDLTLIATAEIPLAGYHADEIIAAGQLPLLYAAGSPSYRVEGGAYGKYSRGLYRVHQFNKVEMYVYCRPQDSEQWHQKLVALEEQVCQDLEIPYRVVRIAAGDLGAPAYKKYDLEYWSPAEGAYRELMSCSNCTDFQARRLNIRTRGPKGQTEFVHTLNGTAAAFSRMPIALLENHQQADGSIKVPKVLQSYYGGSQL